jgi:hypothetical protein
VTPHEGSIVIVFSGSMTSFRVLDLQDAISSLHQTPIEDQRSQSSV